MSYTTLQHDRDTVNTVEAMCSKESLKKHQFLHIAAKVTNAISMHPVLGKKKQTLIFLDMPLYMFKSTEELSACYYQCVQVVFYAKTYTSMLVICILSSVLPRF